MAEITGFHTSKPRLSNWPAWVIHISDMGVGAVMKLLMSAPVVKDFSPAPVTMATRMAGSSRTVIQALDRPS